MKAFAIMLALILLSNGCEKDKATPLSFVQGKIVEMESQAGVSGLSLKLYCIYSQYNGEYSPYFKEDFDGYTTTDNAGYFKILYDATFDKDNLVLIWVENVDSQFTNVRIGGKGGLILNVRNSFLFTAGKGENCIVELIRD